MKKCTKCNLPKTLDQFTKSSSFKDGMRNWCKSCFSTYDKQRRKTLTPEYIRGRSLVRYWPNLSPLEAYQQYSMLLQVQNGRCSICRKPPLNSKSLNVDHCHESNKIRGLLCDTCNSGLGMFKDNLNLMREAMVYLERDQRTYDTVSQAYLGVLADVYKNPDYISSPRGQKCREKLDYTFKILNPTNDPIVTKDEERNKVITSYTHKEMYLYDSGTNNVDDFATASSFWKKIANPDGTINSAYGHLIWYKKSHGSDFEKVLVDSPSWSFDRETGQSGFDGGTIKEMVPVRRTPWEWAKQSLINDKDTRQAILRFSLPEHQWQGNKDQTCTMHGNFLIRQDKLHLSVVMRSNDLTLGLVYDLPWFCSLLDKMVDELKPYYPDLVKGHYTHTVHSLHIYERDEEKIKKMLGVVND